MALSQESLDAIQAAKDAVEEYKDKRVAEIEDEVKNLRNYGVPLDTLATDTTEAATDDAMTIIEGLLS